MTSPEFDDFDQEPEEIELEAKLSEIEAIEEVIAAPLPTDERIQELYKQIRELEKEAEAEKSRRVALRRQKYLATRDADDLRAKISLKREAKLQAAKMADQFAEMDMLTKDAAWRLGIEVPDGDGAVKTIKMMDYQLHGSHFMASAKCVINADEMGLGKTVQTIAATDMLGAKRVLVIAPNAVVANFAREYKKWSPKRPVMVLSRRTKAEQFQLLSIFREQERFVLIINYEAWGRNKKLLENLEFMQFDTVICDEAHTIKETDTSAYKGVAQLMKAENTCNDCGHLVAKERCTQCGSNWGFSPSVENRIFLTGTPILNSPLEIWPLLHLINPHIFFSKTSFQRSFLHQGADGKWYFQEGGMAKLAAQLQGIYIRRTTEESGIVLPPQDVQIVELELNANEYPKQVEIIEMLRNYAQIMLENGETIDTASQLALITRQRQAAVWPGGIWINREVRDEDGCVVYELDKDGENYVPKMEKFCVGDFFKESIKIDTVMNKLTEYKLAGKRTVIFSQFAQVIEEILRRSEDAGIRAAGYYGKTSQVDRDSIERNFDRSVGEVAKWDAVVCHYKTGGVGLNFTAATHMILTDEEWNGGKEDQAMKRIFRMGQTQETTVEILRIDDGIDTWLANLIERKRNMNESFNEENKIYAELNDILTRKPSKNND